MIEYALQYRIDSQDYENNKDILCMSCERKMVRLLGTFIHLTVKLSQLRK